MGRELAITHGRGYFQGVSDGDPPVLIYQDISHITAVLKRSRLRHVPIGDAAVESQLRALSVGTVIRVTEATDWDAPGIPNKVVGIAVLEDIDQVVPDP